MRGNMNETILKEVIEELDKITDSIENFVDFQINDTIAQQIPEEKEEDTNLNMTLLSVDLLRAKEEIERAKKQVNIIFKLLK